MTENLIEKLNELESYGLALASIADLSKQHVLDLCQELRAELDYRVPQNGINQEVTDFIYHRDFPTTVSVKVCPKCGARYSQLDGDKACRMCGQLLKLSKEW